MIIFVVIQKIFRINKLFPQFGQQLKYLITSLLQKNNNNKEKALC